MEQLLLFICDSLSFHWVDADGRSFGVTVKQPWIGEMIFHQDTIIPVVAKRLVVLSKSMNYGLSHWNQ